MRVLLVPLVLACAACAHFGPPPAQLEVISQRLAPDDATCRIYYAHVQMDGRESNLAGRACKQSDGTWRVAEGPPENPTQTQTVYAPETMAIFSSWSNNPPIGISLGRPVVFWAPRDPIEGADFRRSR